MGRKRSDSEKSATATDGIAPRRGLAYNHGMVGVTFIFSAILIGMGLAAYGLSGAQSWTALIPAIAGVLLLVCALIGRNAAYRKHAMHAAVALATLGLLGSVPGLVNLVKWGFTGTSPARPTATWVQSAMAMTLLVYVILSVRSFITARRGGGIQSGL